MASPIDIAKRNQRDWAGKRSISLDDQGYTRELARNLFQPLSPETREEFKDGDGGELGAPDQRGKMQALHSSSALACNVFEYWRHRDRRPLAEALGLGAEIAALRFEQKFPSGLRGNAPNLDVVLALNNGVTFAIESKFLETYGKHTTGFKAKYFEAEQGLWAGRGFANCQALAQALQDSRKTFRCLHAEQLLKHILGLSYAAGPWHLHYLWYRVDHPDADAHQAETEEFSEIVRRDAIKFSAQTYQALYAAFEESAGAGDRLYLDYLKDRYFSDSR